MTDTEPTGQGRPTVIAQMLDQYPSLLPTIDPNTLIGRMLTYGDHQCQPRSN